MRGRDRIFLPVLVALLTLSAAPFWSTHLLPMQDYPQILALARAYGDCQDPSSPFYGTYERGFTFGPLLLPILALRGISAIAGLENAGRVMWTVYAVGLPLACLDLIRALGRDRWSVLLVFPLVFSYWVSGGFFAFATAAPLLVLALAFAVRWFQSSDARNGAGFAVIACALELWHSLVFAEAVFAFSVLWLLRRYARPADRAEGAAPLAPPLALFAVWLVLAVLRRGAGSRAPTWAPLLENASHFFDYVGPVGPAGTGATLLVALLFASVLLVRREATVVPGPFRADNPLGWMALASAVAYFVLPSTCFGVEGVANRQPWFAALFATFALGFPLARLWRVVWLASIGVASTAGLVAVGRRFAAFDHESVGASRLIDRLRPGETLLAPMNDLATPSFPPPAKPLSAVELYATIRHGSLPDTSFAGYDVNIVRYRDGKNPMPGLRTMWRSNDEALLRYDYVMLRAPVAPDPPPFVVLTAFDGEFRLYAVCGARPRPECP